MDAMSQALAEKTNNPKAHLEAASGGGYAGGGGASTGAAKDTSTGKKYFYKSTGHWGLDMLRAEYRGISDMYETHTIRVPEPIAVGTSDSNAFVLFEYMSMGGSRTGETAVKMGKQLAQMHRKTSPNGKYGWSLDNTCGATPQPNTWKDTWIEFWDEMRLGHMLKLCAREGHDFPNQQELRAKVKALLSEREETVVPSLLHGDLWTGNVGATDEGDPCIFDPATYYGDREADLAMTSLFGSLSPQFYEEYQKEWPLAPGYEKRKTVYNLYHILNHMVLFGGGYRSQAQRMIDQIMKM